MDQVNTLLIVLYDFISVLVDQHDGDNEQQRESDISKSVDLIELLCQDQVRDLSSRLSF